VRTGFDFNPGYHITARLEHYRMPVARERFETFQATLLASPVEAKS
jgi:hypothetical protein